MLVSIHAPAGGRDNFGVIVSCGYCVSIHAPAGGRDEKHKMFKLLTGVSIHAPAGGRDCYLYMHLILNTLRTPFREPFLSHLS